jgi:hypothetical protein
MRKKYNKRKEGIILILIALGLFIGGAYVYSNKSNEPFEVRIDKNTKINEISTTTTTRKVVDTTPVHTEDISKKATLTFADQTIEFSISNNTTVYDAMNSLVSEGKISFEGREYPSLGYFVTSIGSLESGNGKNLMYYINGKEASLGVSSYVVQEGDIIEWKLK